MCSQDLKDTLGNARPACGSFKCCLMSNLQGLIKATLAIVDTRVDRQHLQELIQDLKQDMIQELIQATLTGVDSRVDTYICKRYTRVYIGNN